MQATIIEIPVMESTVPQSLDEYLERVRQNNQWYYSHDAITFRIWFNMRTWFGFRLDDDELRKAIHFCLSQEEMSQREGVPEALRAQTD